MNRYEDVPGFWKKIQHPSLRADIWVYYQKRIRAPKPYEDAERTSQFHHDLGITSFYGSLYPATFKDGNPILTAFTRDSAREGYDETYDDAAFTLFGVQGSYEHEMGNHPILTDKQKAKVKQPYYRKSLNFKLDHYSNFFFKHPDRFMLMDVEHWIGTKFDRLGTDRLFDEYLEFLGRYKFADHILLCRHRDAVGDPDHTEGEIHHDDMGDAFGDIWFCPASPDDPTSIQKWLQTSKWISTGVSN